MKTKITGLLIAFLISLSGLYAQNVISVSATDSDISDNLNLEAVATLFGQSKNLADFENQLNNPKNQVSNLDLNQDGYVDYIRVVENRSNGTYLITLQDVLGENLYQDIATIYVEKDAFGSPQVQIIGNTYIYGPDYIIEPIYVHRPLLFSLFWRPYYKVWRSPYYWNHYPYYYKPWRRYALNRYRRNIHRFIMSSHYYRYTTHRRSHAAWTYYQKYRRNDYERRHPEHAFHKRFSHVKNRHELNLKRRNPNTHYTRPVKVKRPSRTVRVKRPNSDVNYRRNNSTTVKRRVVPSERIKSGRSTVVRNRKNTVTRSRTVSPRSSGVKNKSTYRKTTRPTRSKTVRVKRSAPKKVSRATKAKPVKKERVKKKREKR